MIAGTDLFIGLFNNLAIFIVLVAVYGFLNTYFEKSVPFRRQTAVGICFGLFAIACMYVKIPVADGVIVDQRNAVVALSGAFGGPLSAVLCAIMAGAYRGYLGGAGVLAGISGVTLAAVSGIGLHTLRKKTKRPLPFSAGAALATVVILPGFLLVKDFHTGLNLMAAMAVPYGSAIFSGIFLVGLLLSHEENRRESELEHRHSEKRFRDMFERLVDVSYRTDAQGRIVYMSPSANHVFGFPLEELTGIKIGEFYRFPARRNEFVKRLMQDKRVENFEAEIRRKDGTFVWVSTNAIMLTDEMGNFIGVEGVTRDISRLKKAEEAKLQLEASLRQSQKMEALGTLAGGIAHDFNNILGAVFGFTELALENQKEGSIERHYLESVMAAADRAAQLTRQILMFSCKGKPVKTPVRIHLVVTEAVNLLKKTIPATVQLHVVLDEKTGTISADPTQMHQIVLNLCTNAYHALPTENGTIEILLGPVDLDHAAAAQYPNLKAGRYAQLTIKDNGEGITQEILPRIFEPFFTTKEKGKGTGLGLSVVHGIVMDHSGAVGVDSTVGNGTAFRVLLPIACDADDDKVHVPPQIKHGAERILLVDDETTLVDVGKAVLEGLHYTVFATTSPKEALDIFRNAPNDYNLIITDQTMPEMSGDALAKEAIRIRPDIPVIVCTGHSTVLDAAGAQAIGIRAFLMKPVSRQTLAETVREVLDASA